MIKGMIEIRINRYIKGRMIEQGKDTLKIQQLLERR